MPNTQSLRRSDKSFPSTVLFVSAGLIIILGIIEFLVSIFSPTNTLLLIVALLFVASGIFSAILGVQRIPRVAERRFRERYYGSIDLMLQDSKVDKGRVRMLRNRGPKGEITAIQYVISVDPVPYEVAVEFVHRASGIPTCGAPGPALATPVDNGLQQPTPLAHGAMPAPHSPPLDRRSRGTQRHRFSVSGVFIGLAVACVIFAIVGISCAIVFYPLFASTANLGGSGVLAMLWFGSILMLAMAAFSIATGAKRASVSARLYYYSHYGSSIERMLQESQADKDLIRSLRHEGPRGETKAIRYVLRLDAIPYEVAEEFVRRL